MTDNVITFRSHYERAQDAQAAAALPDRSAWVEAHAGSGKTKVLIDRVARLLLRREDGRKGAAPDTILCITYTKAAANEMLSRLFKQLGNWSVAGDEDLRKELARLERRDESAYDDAALDDARTLFARALETPGGLRIETIHAFCSRILRRFPLEAGVSPGFGEIEDQDADRLWNEAMREEILAAADTAPDALATLSEAGGGLGAASVLSSISGARSALTGLDPEATKNRVRIALDAPDETAASLIAHAVGEGLPRADIQSAITLLDSHDKPGKSDTALLETLVHCLSDAPEDERFERYCSVFLTAAGDWRKSNPYTKGVGDRSNLLPSLFQMKDGDGQEAARIRALLRDLKARLAYERTAALIREYAPDLVLCHHTADHHPDHAAANDHHIVIFVRQLNSHT
mgnify:FL=1